MRHVQQLSIAEMRMLWWICGHTRTDYIQNRNDDIRERLGVAPVKEKLMQHHLRWFGHIQRRPLETPVRSRVISQTNHEKRDRRTNLTWEESVKRDLKDWSITKELALDRRGWKLAIHVTEPWSSVPPLLLPFLLAFPPFLPLLQFFFTFVLSVFQLLWVYLYPTPTCLGLKGLVVVVVVAHVKNYYFLNKIRCASAH
jgi:hypothetical protein